MFSVYGTTGRLFQGRMEHMPPLGTIAPVARLEPIESIGHEQQPLFPGLLATAAAKAGVTTPAVHAPPSHEEQRSALAAYTRAQRPSIARHPLSTVDALMSQEVITIPLASSIYQAWRLLDRHGIGQAPVVNGDMVLVGLLARSDVLHSDRLPLADNSMLAWRILLSQNVSNIMQSPVPSVSPDTDIRRVARVLLDTGLAGLPVVNAKGVVIGFVSRADIFRAVVTDPPLDLWG